MKLLNRKLGFTVIELLIVLVILAMATFIAIIVIGDFRTAEEKAYYNDRENIEEAVLDYFDARDSWSVTGAEITIEGTICEIVNICSVRDLGYLEEIPESCAEIGANDNCEAGVNCSPVNCNPDAHYIWTVDPLTRSIRSAMVDDSPDYIDGFRGVYP